MEKKYEKIDLRWGSSLGECVVQLINHSVKNKTLASGDFNGTTLYSDTVSLDSAYSEVTGMTYFERCEADIAEKVRRDKEEQERQTRLPSNIAAWIERGSGLVKPEKFEYWTKIVPIRANDLYHGMELNACLDIIEILNAGCSIASAKKKIDDQNHSGMSYSLVRALVREFAERGEEFVEYGK